MAVPRNTTLVESETIHAVEDSSANLAYSFHNPVAITSNSDFTAQGFSGQGTEVSPYLLTNLNITSQTAVCILVANTTSHFRIQGCWFSSEESIWGQGLVTFENVENGDVENNVFASGYIAISATQAINCKFSSNLFGTSLMGFLGYNLQDNEISNNEETSESIGYPIHVEDSEGVVIENNQFLNCLYEGIGLTSSVDCLVEDNILHGNSPHLGQYAFAIRNSRACTLTSNNATNFGTAIDVTNGQMHVVTLNYIDTCYGGMMIRGNDTVITYNTIWSTGYGIETRESFRTEIRNNEFLRSRYVTSIDINRGGDSIISENIIHEADYGIRVQGSRNLEISYNLISNCYSGISLQEVAYIGLQDAYPENCFIKKNNLENCSISFSISDPAGLDHVITGNLVNGREIVYYYKASDLEIHGDEYGQIILADCEDISITGGTLDEILVMFSSTCEISNVQIGNGTNGIYIRNSAQIAIGYSHLFGNDVGIHIESSNRCQIVRTTACNNGYGILLDTSPNATVYNCNLYNNDYGLVLIGAHQSMIESCHIYQNSEGIFLLRTNDAFIGNNEFIENYDIGLLLNRGSRYNRIVSNSFGWNTIHVVCSGIDNMWDDGIKRGNRWSDLGDALIYIIDEDDVDRYPMILGEGISTTNSTSTTISNGTIIPENVRMAIGVVTGFAILVFIAVAINLSIRRNSE